MITLKECERKDLWSNLRDYRSICKEGLRRITKSLRQDRNLQDEI
jgi:hypothetical protein